MTLGTRRPVCRFVFSALPSVRRYLARWTVLAVFLQNEAKRAPGGFISDYGKSLVAGPVLGGLRECCHSVFEPINWKREMATNLLATSEFFNAWFWGRPGIVDFWGLGGPGGRKTPSEWRGASRPTLWKGFPGRRDRPDLQNRRSPARPKTMYKTIV